MGSESMVELCARAIYDELVKQDTGYIGDYSGGYGSVIVVDMSVNIADVARAAIAAMREPTRDMLVSGISAIEDAYDTTTDSYETYTITNAADYALPGWHAMIDAALAEPQP
jgi:hypothetical protein